MSPEREYYRPVPVPMRDQLPDATDARRGKPQQSAFFWVTLAVTAIYVGLFAFSTYELSRHYGLRKAAGWGARASPDGWFVRSVEANGPAGDAIHVGDRLLAIDGDERAGVLGAFRLINVKEGQPYRVDVERNGQRLSTQLTMSVGPGRPASWLFLVYSLAFFSCGATLGFLRPADAQVRLMAAGLMMVGLSMFYDTLVEARGFMVGWERRVLIVILSLSGWAFPMSYHSFGRFPTWTSPGPLWRSVQWLLYGAAILVFLPSWVTAHAVSLGLSADLLNALAVRPRLSLIVNTIAGTYLFVYLQVCLALTLVVVARNYRRLSDPDSRRRIRWVVAGNVAASLPWLGLMFAFWVAGWVSSRTYTVAYPFVSLSMLCIPVSTVLAVWKDQLFDIRVIVRRGLQYLFARAALRALLVLPFLVLGISILSNPNRTLIQILTEGAVWLNVAAVVAIGAALKFRHRFQSALDRRFFREAYEQEQVL